VSAAPWDGGAAYGRSSVRTAVRMIDGDGPLVAIEVDTCGSTG